MTSDTTGPFVEPPAPGRRAPIPTGHEVGRYRIEALVGAGGMGEVYRARDTQLERSVAIKFLSTPADDLARRRLLREARTVASLEHPAIVGVIEVGEDAVGGDYLVMPFAEGETLSARLRRGPLPPDEAFALIVRILEALAEAHRHGVVHRDLKPQNIIISPAGLPKLLDFGLARFSPESAAAAGAITTTVITSNTATVGTPGYMAPEQLRSDVVDPRSDLFAVGCVMYECLTGRRAFVGSTTAELFGAVLHLTPPMPSSLRPGVPPWADAICEKLLQKSPDDRYQNADAVMADFRRMNGGLVRRRWSRRWLAAAAVIVTLGAGTWYLASNRPLRPPTAEAGRWYTLGLEALREGSVATAEADLAQAATLDPEYPMVYLRLAEARRELDRSAAAKDALVQFSRLVPNRDRLSTADALRLRAIEASVLRRHTDAVAAYRELAERTPTDPSGWLDLGRAEDDAGFRTEARAHYEKARDLDGEYPPARVRLGVLLGQLGEIASSVREFDTAIRIYSTAGNAEGEAEALVRKANALLWAGRTAESEAAADRALALSTGPRFVSQATRATFSKARLAAVRGDFTRATTLGSKAVESARTAGLMSLAATGLYEMGPDFASNGNMTEAEAVIEQAIRIAQENGAEVTEMRARLQLAGLRYDQRRYQDALNVSDEPLAYFRRAGYPRNEAEAQIIRSAAFEGLDRMTEAEALTASALAFANRTGDQTLLTQGLENHVAQLASLGRLPEALQERERADALYRAQQNAGSLGFSLLSHASLLVQVGRVADARVPMAELEQKIAEGVEAFLPRRPRLWLVKSAAAALSGAWPDVERLASEVITLGEATTASASTKSAALQARAIREYARARSGTRGTPVAELRRWPDAAVSSGVRREVTYWCAQALLERGERASAAALVGPVWQSLPPTGDPEVRYRLTALTVATMISADASAKANVETSRAALVALWGEAVFKTYLTRADLVRFR